MSNVRPDMSTRTFVRYFLQVAGIVSLVISALAALFYGFVADTLGASKIERESVSPNGRVRAIQAATSTGSVGYCYQFVVLAPADRPVEVPSYGHSKDQAVFAVDCIAPVEVRWLDDSHLKIELDLTQDKAVQVVRMRREDLSNHVVIRYEVNSQ